MNGKQIISLVLGSTLSGCNFQEPLSNLPLQERLKALAERSSPKLESVNAMCYAQAAVPSKENYHCPECGNKTAYEVKFLSKSSNRARDMDWSWEAPVINVKRMRDEVKKLAPLAQQNGYKFLLDESGLCAKCGKGKKVDLVLVAISPEGKETRTTGIDKDDFLYLTAFFEGKDYYEDIESYPLKKKVGRIAELLGLSLD